MALGFHQGRCSARNSMVLATTLLALLLLRLETVDAATFTVGDDSPGWTFGVGNWPEGKKFKAGDTLVFRFDPSLHNVVVVEKDGYDSCTSSANSKSFNSGNVQIKLSKGQNYFICSISGHCDTGLKIAVTAS